MELKERLVEDEEKRRFLLLQFGRWKHNQDPGIFAEFVLSVLCESVSRQVVMSEIADMGLGDDDGN